MSLVEPSSSPVVLRLNRDLVRAIKRGHPWVYADALRDLPNARAGTPAMLLDNRKGQPVALGFYDPSCPVAFRVCDGDPDSKLDDRWAVRRLRDAIALRRSFTSSDQITGYRLLNGEGDKVSGLVVDRYSDTAVLKLDGEGPAGFWNSREIAEWLAHELGLTTVYERQKDRESAGRVLVGAVPDAPVSFLEYGLPLTADVVRGQKTGFFLDQRENRQLIRQWSSGQRVLNVFSYTGGFSVAAGAGEAAHVTSIDISRPAIETANQHWNLNGFALESHSGIVADAFEFLTDAYREKTKWDIVILDPPSFAHNRESVPKAMSAYQSMIEAGARVTAVRGLLAVSSCSSHVDLPMFLDCCEEGISKARRSAIVLSITGQPVDHPTPLALPEFRYLKFVLMRLD